MNWACGVTTIPSRMTTLLPGTLASLKEGGFDNLRLFIDGQPSELLSRILIDQVSIRIGNVGVYGNWLLGIIELYLRNPYADRYAMFQDDVICYKNLRQFLEQSPYPDKGYLNLYTYLDNEYQRGWDHTKDIPTNAIRPGGWSEAGWINRKEQSGRGALALVFSKQALLTLLTSPHTIERVQSPTRGHKYVDGGVCGAMNKAGWKEYVHLPTLVEHTGWDKSSIGNDPYVRAQTWRGEQFDALSLLAKS